MRVSMILAVRRGLYYFLAVFAVGFVLGAIRTLVLIPVIGEVGGVLVELPVMLAISWLICGALCHQNQSVTDATVMGGTAFALLMLAEAGLSLWLWDRTLIQHLALYTEPVHLLGLAGQVAFASFPLLHRRSRPMRVQL